MRRLWPLAFLTLAFAAQRQQLSFSPTNACPPGAGAWAEREKGRLRVYVSGTACSGSGCEAHAGSERIEGTNLGNGLRLLGHDVRFRGCGDLEGADVVLAKPGGDLEALRKDGRIVVVMKTDSKGQWAWVSGADLYLSNSGLHALFHSARGGLSPEKAVTLRLVEVPTTYWARRQQGDQADMYAGIPKHQPAPSAEFGRERPARLCYHGNRYHLALEGSLLAALRRLPARLGAPVRLTLVQDGDEGLLRALGGVANLSVAQVPWVSMDGTYAQLANCDLGLVPNLEEPPSFAVNQQVRNDQVAVKYKGSSNAGRAFVFAQLGLPFAMSPEFEAAELLGAAGLRSRDFMAMGEEAWGSVLLGLLRDLPLRQQTSKALRAFAERELRIEPEAKELEKRILAARERRLVEAH